MLLKGEVQRVIVEFLHHFLCLPLRMSRWKLVKQFFSRPHDLYSVKSFSGILYQKDGGFALVDTH
jgi:hypothetical protein